MTCKNIILFLTAAFIITGCGAHRVTSTPPGAEVWLQHASKERKPVPDMLYNGGNTPYVNSDGPFGHWYQVRMPGYADSELIYLPSAIFSERSYHFTLEHN